MPEVKAQHHLAEDVERRDVRITEPVDHHRMHIHIMRSGWPLHQRAPSGAAVGEPQREMHDVVDHEQEDHDPGEEHMPGRPATHLGIVRGVADGPGLLVLVLEGDRHP